MQCRICNNETERLFSATVLSQYDVQYYRCPQCLFLQTEEPYWLPEAYSTAITRLDIGLLQRNIAFSQIVSAVITVFFDRKQSFLDFAGGYGVFTRLMRDRGFDYYHQDKFCENLFAQNFGVPSGNAHPRFEMLSAFELFEHLPDPMQAIEEMLSYSDSILFSTVLQPPALREADDWPYIAPEIGQHISFYHRSTLEYIAQQKKISLFTNGKNFHLFSRKKISPLLFSIVSNYQVAPFISSLTSGLQKSLLEKDYAELKKKIRDGA